MKFHLDTLLSLTFTSAVVFGFYTLCSPIVGTVLLNAHLRELFSAPLFAFALGQLIKLFFSKPLKTPQATLVFQYLAFFSIPVSLYAFANVQSSLDALVVQKYDPQSFAELSPSLSGIAESFSPVLMVAIGGPFLFFGLFVSNIFSYSQPSIYKLVLAELVGILLAFLLFPLGLDFFDMREMFAALGLLGMLGLYFQTRSILQPLLVLIVFFTVSFFSNSFLPQRDVHWSARDIKKEHGMKLVATEWNSYTQVQLIKVDYFNRKWHKVSLGNGTGVSTVPIRETHTPLTALASVHQPQNVLVLFAGNGRELVSLHKSYSSEIPLVGVEISQQVINMSRHISYSPVHEVLAQENVNLIQDDARRYLENCKEGFDSILFSWSGATFAHFSGSLHHTTQYAYTYEALESALNCLKDDGVLVIASKSKVNLLLTLMDLRGRAKDSALLVGVKNKERQWENTWDDIYMVFKKGVFSQSEKEQYQEVANAFRRTLLNFEKGDSDPILSGLLEFGNSEEAKKYLSTVSDLNFQVFYDDRPFIFDFEKKGNVYSIGYWVEFIKRNMPPEGTLWLLISAGLLIAFLSIALSFFFNSPSSSFLPLSTFVIILAGFVNTSLMVLTTMRLLLFLGHPTYSLIFANLVVFVGSSAALATRFPLSLKWIFSVPVLFSPWIFFSAPNQMFSGSVLLFFSCIPLMFIAALTTRIYVEQLNVARKSELIPFMLFANTSSAALAALLTPIAIKQAGIKFAFSVLLVLFAIMFLSSLVRLGPRFQTGSLCEVN